jgi:hypothetical protein
MLYFLNQRQNHFTRHNEENLGIEYKLEKLYRQNDIIDDL